MRSFISVHCTRGEYFCASAVMLTDCLCRSLTDFSILGHAKLCCPPPCGVSAQPGMLPTDGNFLTLFHSCKVTSLAGGGWEALGLGMQFWKTLSPPPSARAGCPGPFFTARRRQKFGVPHVAPYACPIPLLSNGAPSPCI